MDTSFGIDTIAAQLPVLGGSPRLLAESTVSFAPIKTTILASAARAGCWCRLIFLHPGGRIEGSACTKCQLGARFAAEPPESRCALPAPAEEGSGWFAPRRCSAPLPRILRAGGRGWDGDVDGPCSRDHARPGHGRLVGCE
jgi:hypothetical protein